MIKVRGRGVVLGVLLSAASAMGLVSACATPTAYSVVNATGGIWDAAGNMIVRLGVNETIGYDQGDDFVTRNDGGGYYNRVGWNAIIPTSYWFATPTYANGPVGPRQWHRNFWGGMSDNRSFVSHYDVMFGIDYGSVHIGIPEGTCELDGYFAFNGAYAHLTGAAPYCSNVRAYAVGQVVDKPAVITGPYASLSSTQKAHVQDLIAQLRKVGDATKFSGNAPKGVTR